MSGTAVNQDGRSANFAAPSGHAQQRVMLGAMKHLSAQPNSMESHGTGTVLGDPVEVDSLHCVLTGSSLCKPATVGAFKTRKGHTEYAAGMAGVVKATLLLINECIHPNLHLQIPNPHLAFEDFPTLLPSQLAFLKGSTGVNSFGFTGTNCCAVLEDVRNEAPLTLKHWEMILYQHKVFAWWNVNCRTTPVMLQIPNDPFAASSNTARLWERKWSEYTCGYLSHHRVGYTPVAPCSAYLCMMIRSRPSGIAQTCCVVKYSFIKMLCLEGDAPFIRVNLECPSSDRTHQTVELSSHSGADEWSTHATAVLDTDHDSHSTKPPQARHWSAQQHWSEPNGLLAVCGMYQHVCTPIAIHANTSLPSWLLLSKRPALCTASLCIAVQGDGVTRHMYCTTWSSASSEHAAPAEQAVGLWDMDSTHRHDCVFSTTTHAMCLHELHTSCFGCSTIETLLVSASDAELHAVACSLALIQSILVYQKSLVHLWVIIPHGLQSHTSYALSGLIKVVNVEVPQLKAVSVHMAAARSHFIDQVLLRTHSHANGELIVDQRGQVSVRHLEQFSPATIQLSCSSSLDLSACLSAMLVGGTGGLGVLVASWFAKHGALRLALLSRSGKLADHVESSWEAACSTHTSVCIEECGADCNGSALGATGVNCVDAVVHAAGVLRDGLLPNQTQNALQQVWASKAHVAWELHQAGRVTKQSVGVFVLFSSVAALLGSTGQANYAAANASMDGLACLRQRQQLPAISMQWGAWAGAGMAAISGALSHLEQLGGTAIAQETGLCALELAMCSGLPMVGMMPVKWSALLASIGPSIPTFLSRMLDESPPHQQATQVHDRQSLTLTASLRSMSPQDRMAQLVTLITKQACALGVRTAAHADDPLVDAGLDSLGAIELRNQLVHSLGGTLAATIAFDHPTGARGASYLTTCGSFE